MLEIEHICGETSSIHRKISKWRSMRERRPKRRSGALVFSRAALQTRVASSTKWEKRIDDEEGNKFSMKEVVCRGCIIIVCLLPSQLIFFFSILGRITSYLQPTNEQYKNTVAFSALRVPPYKCRVFPVVPSHVQTVSTEADTLTMCVAGKRHVLWILPLKKKDCLINSSE